MDLHDRGDQPSKDGLPEKLLTLGTWVVAIGALVIVVGLVIFLVRLGTGDVDSLSPIVP